MFLLIKVSMTDISEKNTKKEIIEAYQALLKQKGGEETLFRIEEKTERKEKGNGSVEGIIATTKNLQNSVSDAIQKIFEKLLEFGKKAEDEEETFRAEVSQRKKQWGQEQEEYVYATKITRKREQDEYELKKQTLERELCERIATKESELKEREKSLNEQEEETKILRKSVETFPTELKKAVDEATRATKTEIEARIKIEIELTKKDSEKEREIAKLTMSALEETIKRQAGQIANLERQLAQASQKAQELAVKVIESANASSKREERQERKEKE